MRLKWHFGNEPTSYFKETTVFAPKLEDFLSQIEKELFESAETSLRYLKKNGKL